MAKATKPKGDATTENGGPPAAEIQIDRIAAETIRVPIVGTTPLIIHRFSEKAKLKMLNEMQGRRTPKEPKDPEAEYEAAFYRLEDGSRLPGARVQGRHGRRCSVLRQGRDDDRAQAVHVLPGRGWLGRSSWPASRASRSCARTSCGSAAAEPTFATGPSSANGRRRSRSSTSPAR